MTKEQWQEKLIEDPRFDADWIDLVSTLLSTYSSEQLEEVGIPHLDDLVSIDIRMIHIINSLLKNYNFDEPNTEYKNDLISTMISYIVKQVHPMNATQAQLIATVIGAVASGDVEDPDIEKKFTSDLIGDRIEANIPYSSLNFIAKAVLEGHSEILEYVNSDTKTVAELYAAMVENVYVRIKKVLNFDLYTKDRCLDVDYIGLHRIRLVRFLITNHYDFTIDSENNIVVK